MCGMEIWTIVGAVLVMLCLIKLFTFVSRLHFIDGAVQEYSSQTRLSKQLLPRQVTQPVYNPFDVNLKKAKNSIADGEVEVTVSAHKPCWLGVYWGVRIADFFPVLNRQWNNFSDVSATDSSLQSISKYSHSLELHEAVSNHDLAFVSPIRIDLGPPPRDRYPLVLIMMDPSASTMTSEEAETCTNVVFMAVIIHVKDDVCCADADILSKLVRTPHGKPLDLQLLFVSEDNADRSQCVVCRSEPVRAALLPCRHACVCTNCLQFLSNCPLCRRFIVSSLSLESHHRTGIVEEPW